MLNHHYYDKTNQKLELLLNDLKINSKEEKETGKSYFNTNLFAIRIKEISKTLNGESNEQWGTRKNNQRINK